MPSDFPLQSTLKTLNQANFKALHCPFHTFGFLCENHPPSGWFRKTIYTDHKSQWNLSVFGVLDPMLLEGLFLVTIFGHIKLLLGSWFPNRGSNLGPQLWKHWVLPTGPPGKSLLERLSLGATFILKQHKRFPSAQHQMEYKCRQNATNGFNHIPSCWPNFTGHDFNNTVI